MNRWVNQLRVYVSPLQGWITLFGPSSQGVALGCRVLAPSARRQAGANTIERWVSRRAGANVVGANVVPPWTCRDTAPTGRKSSAWGNAPGTRAINSPSPERATPGHGHAPARGLERTIAHNVVEILEE